MFPHLGDFGCVDAKKLKPCLFMMQKKKKDLMYSIKIAWCHSTYFFFLKDCRIGLSRAKKKKRKKVLFLVLDCYCKTRHETSPMMSRTEPNINETR